MCDRLDVRRNTQVKRLTKPDFRQPGRDGKWLLSNAIAWDVDEFLIWPARRESNPRPTA